MNPSIAYSQRTNNYHVINQVQVSSKKIKIAYDIVKDGRVESYTLVSAEKHGRNSTRPCTGSAVMSQACSKLTITESKNASILRTSNLATMDKVR